MCKEVLAKSPPEAARLTLFVVGDSVTWTRTFTEDGVALHLRSSAAALTGLKRSQVINKVG
jgi:hypothetical protein